MMRAEVRDIASWTLLYDGPADFIKLSPGVVELRLTLFGVQRYDARHVLVVFWHHWRNFP